jgi:arylsulfatase
VLLLSGCLAASDQRPNIVLVMADDLGFSDVGAYGGEIRTPNLDQLANEGLRFMQFYNAGRCCPTRASLLTGRYSHEVGMGRMVAGHDAVPEPGPYQGYVDTTVVTVADALAAAGYATYMSGKWHIGENAAFWPRKQGFDRYFGLISGASSYWEIITDQPRHRQMALDDDPWQPPEQGFYMTDAITDHALTFLGEHQQMKEDVPFFLYVAYTAPHWPLHAPQEEIERYVGDYDGGWDSLRTVRYARMKAMGLIDERYMLTERTPSIPSWEETENKEDWSLRMAVYAAMVDRMDQGIGRIVNQLREMGASDNTLIVFLADNGACAETITGRNLHDPNIPIGKRGSYAAYREPWANASNTPFRLYKQWQHEGGVRTPFIVHWPKGISAPGSINGSMGHIIDIMPTFLELAKAENVVLDREPLDGRSLVDILSNNEHWSERELFFEHIGNRAIRQGRWKLVWDRRAEEWELYDMEIDPVEANNLSAVFPQRADSLRLRWEAWARDVGVQL